MQIPTTGGWISKLWDIYIMEYYTATKGNELQIQTLTCPKRTDDSLSERNQAQENMLYDSIYVKQNNKQMSWALEGRGVVTSGCGHCLGRTEGTF